MQQIETPKYLNKMLQAVAEISTGQQVQLSSQGEGKKKPYKENRVVCNS